MPERGYYTSMGYWQHAHALTQPRPVLRHVLSPATLRSPAAAARIAHPDARGVSAMDATPAKAFPDSKVSDRKSRRIKSGAEAVFNVSTAGYIPVAGQVEPGWLDTDGSGDLQHGIYSARKGVGMMDVSTR